MHRECLVCVICNSSSFHSFIFKLCMVWLFTYWTCAPYILSTFDNMLGIVEFRHYYVYTTVGVLTLCNLCVICNLNRFHSFVFKLFIMIVPTLKMCTDNAGPEQYWSCLLMILHHWNNWKSEVYIVSSCQCQCPIKNPECPYRSMCAY